MLNKLLAISPLDGRYSSQIQPLQAILSEFGLIKSRVIVEIKWLQHLAQYPDLPEIPSLSLEAQEFLNQIIENFSEADAQAIKEIEYTTNHDVKAVEYFLKRKSSTNSEVSNLAEFFHFACTSEDINNLAYGLMLKNAHQSIMLPMWQKLIYQLATMAEQYSIVPMLARTHGQVATPTTVGKELANFAYRLNRQFEQLQTQEFLGKINGAVGNFNAHMVAYPQINWLQLSQDFITQLGLTFNPFTTQIEPHDYVAEYFQNIARFNTILLDLARDMWGYISLRYFKQRLKANEVGSSTMPHKVNPIDFENAEGNLGLANALMYHLSEKLPISRWQRDLSDSTVMRNLGVGLAYSLIAYNSLLKGLNKLEVNTDRLEQDLEENWAVLGEAIQTVMRKHGLEQPYEQLKAFTRGKYVNQANIQAFIQHLDLPTEAKQSLLNLTPHNYVGLASKLVELLAK